MRTFIALLMLISLQLHAQENKLKIIQLSVEADFRGVSCASDQSIWVSGSMGAVCKSTDGGKSFKCLAVPGYEKADFRSVYAFSSQKAIIANVGSPAKIFLTEKGGAAWQEVYVNSHKDAFIDGIDFWDDKTGIAFGDPIEGKLLLLKTMDGGKTWNEITSDQLPETEPGEASFAASGTTIRCFENGKVVVATGGTVSKLLVSNDFGSTWNPLYTPIIQGESSTGIFSFDFANKYDGIIVGGDYKNESQTTDHVFYTSNGALGWQRPAEPTRGYRECVMFVNDTIALASGTNGIDITYDAGNYWEPWSEERNFHTIKKSKSGDQIIFAGTSGKIALLSIKALTEIK